MSFTQKSAEKNQFMLKGPLAGHGYDWWWHSFTGINRRDGSERQFFVEYFLINPALGKDRPVFGQLPENRKYGVCPSYLMIKAGAWGKDARQLHRFFPWDRVVVSNDPHLMVAAGDCRLTDSFMCGSVSVTEKQAEEHPEYMCSSGSMKWELSIEKKVPFNVGYGTGALLRNVNAFEMYWHASGMKSLYSGFVEYCGESYDVIPEKSFGYADKNWGSDFTTPWVWLSSCRLFSVRENRWLENSVFDIGGGRPRVFGIPLERKLLAAFLYEGKEYEFNFSKLWTLTRTSFECHETKNEMIWRIRQSTPFAEMITDMSCQKSEMLLVNYEAPDGSRRHRRLWNGGSGSGRILLYDKRKGKRQLRDTILVYTAGCEYGEFS